MNGPHAVYVERLGKIERTEVRFVDGVHLRRIIDKIVGQVGRRVDEATPMVDARLARRFACQRDHPPTRHRRPVPDDS